MSQLGTTGSDSGTGTALDRLRAAVAGRPPLAPLDPDGYARSHAAFEASSDQRALLTAWLGRRFARRAGGDGSLSVPLPVPLSVLSVGCGDGTVDAPLADLLAAGSGRRVDYVGVEPHPPSADAFSAGLEGLGHPGLRVGTHTTTYDRMPLGATFDVITFVHSLYYVDDVGAALTRAAAQLRPGGEVIVLHAPRHGLNELAGTLAPDSSGHVQWWAEDTAAALPSIPLAASAEWIEGRLDLRRCRGNDPEGRDILDFTVQARLTAELRPLVLDVLDELSQPGADLVVPHVLRAWVLSDLSDGR